MCVQFLLQLSFDIRKKVMQFIAKEERKYAIVHFQHSQTYTHTQRHKQKCEHINTVPNIEFQIILNGLSYMHCE